MKSSTGRYKYLIFLRGNAFIFSYTNSRPDRNSNLGLDGEENPMKKIRKKIDRIMNPLPRDEHDPIEIEYKILLSIEQRVKE